MPTATIGPRPRPPFPPFDEEAARARVLGAEAASNTSDPERVALAHTPDSVRRNRDTFLQGSEGSIDDVAIAESDRRIVGPRPDDDRDGIPLQ